MENIIILWQQSSSTLNACLKCLILISKSTQPKKKVEDYHEANWEYLEKPFTEATTHKDVNDDVPTAIHDNIYNKYSYYIYMESKYWIDILKIIEVKDYREISADLIQKINPAPSRRLCVKITTEMKSQGLLITRIRLGLGRIHPMMQCIKVGGFSSNESSTIIM